MNSINLKDFPNEDNRAGDPTSIRAFLKIIFKRKYIILSVFVGIVSIVTIFTLFMTPVFKASSKILIEKKSENEKSMLFRMNLNLDYNKYDWIKSELEIIKSDPVASKVIKNMNLDQVEFNNAGDQNINHIIDVFESRLNVSNPAETNIIDISYESSDPNRAADVVNNLVKAYIDYRGELFNESEEYQFFEEQIRLAEQKLGDLEKRQTSFKQAEQIISTQAQGDILLTKIADYEKALTEVRTQRIGKEAMLTVIKEQMFKRPVANIPVTESSDSPSREKFIAKLRGELLDLELKRDRLLQIYTPEYAEVINLTKSIANTRERIKKEIDEIVELEDTAIRAQKAEERALQNTINNLNNQIKDFAQKEYELTKLSRGIEDNREVYSMLLKQREEARISQAKSERGIKIKVISPAPVPSTPFKPQRKLKVLLAIILGLASGFGLAFLLEYFDHTLNSPEEIETQLSLPVWGSINAIKVESISAN